MDKKERAERKAFKDKVGEARYELIKRAKERITEAKDNGYYLEAITILESLIADRLESILAKSETNEKGFKALGRLIKKVKNSTTLDPGFKNLIETELDKWKDKRNQALHEMVKLEEGNLHEWDERYGKFEIEIKKGLDIFNEIDKAKKKLDRQK